MPLRYFQTSNQPDPIFKVDEEKSTEEFLFITIRGKGIVIIENGEEKIGMSIFPLSAEGGDKCIAEVYADIKELK